MEGIYLTSDITLKPGKEGELAQHFSGIAYSGGIAKPHNIVIDLASVRIADNMPLLKQHMHEVVIGSILKSDNDKKKIALEGDIFSDIDDAAKEIVLKAERGVQYQMSVGIFDANDEWIPSGKTVEVNGQTFNGPVAVLRDGHIREASIVPLGADDKTSAKFFDPNGADAMKTEELQAQLDEANEKVTALTGERDDAVKRAEKAEADLAAVKKEGRSEKVEAYFKATGREFSEDAAKPYMEMDESAFELMTKDVGEMRGRVPQHLLASHEQPKDTGQNNNSDGGTGLLSAVKSRFNLNEQQH